MTKRTKLILAKFPHTKAKEEDSNLRDTICPDCGARRVFRIEFTGTARVYDDGSEDDGDHEWDSKSWCCCNQCGFSAPLRRFMFPGLDEELEARADKAPAEEQTT